LLAIDELYQDLITHCCVASSQNGVAEGRPVTTFGEGLRRGNLPSYACISESFVDSTQAFSDLISYNVTDLLRIVRSRYKYRSEYSQRKRCNMATQFAPRCEAIANNLGNVVTDAQHKHLNTRAAQCGMEKRW
jgi:hypothetical protein